MIRVLLCCDFDTVRKRLQEKLEENGLCIVEEGEDAALFIPRLTRTGWERDVIERSRVCGTAVIVSKESVPLAEERLTGSGAAVLPSDVALPVLLGVLRAEAKAGERLFAVSGEIDRLREKLRTEKLISRAKLVLMVRGMNEEEAHRFLEKQAMDRRLSRRAVAEEVLKERVP